MAQGWRTIQLFLSPRQPAIYEVEIDLDSSSARCTCPTYKGRKTCRHTKFVSARMDSNSGHYPLYIHEKAASEDLSEVMSTPETFREFVIKYGKVEVL